MRECSKMEREMDKENVSIWMGQSIKVNILMINQAEEVKYIRKV